ncbi:hypothetical protein K7432_005792 [Basidiobolus ranarum]|uniref:Hexosyltransferase n=1 Tax=Basidiobolus ranarum TaxID=34480 RepID=A0ABR2W316_9FUNG
MKIPFRPKILYAIPIVFLFFATTAYLTHVAIIRRFQSLADSILRVSSTNTKKAVIFALTTENNLPTRGKAVGETWGQQAKDYQEEGIEGSPIDVVFATSHDTTPYGLSRIPIEDVGYGDIYKKTYASFYYLYKYHLNDYKWFMKADDDTFVKIHKLMSHINSPLVKPRVPLFVGRPMDFGCWGGPGYLLNREALSIVGPYLFYCEKNFPGFEDVEFGNCVEYAFKKERPNLHFPGCTDFPDGNGHEFLPLTYEDKEWNNIANASYTMKITFSESTGWSFGKAVAIHTVRGEMMYKLNAIYS